MTRVQLGSVLDSPRLPVDNMRIARRTGLTNSRE